MAFNRDSTLRKAEKLLKQGRLDAAIAEYAQVVKNQPKDWNTTNTLGDLYVRAGQVDNGAKQYIRIADHLATEGFYPKAAAVYKKILKIKPDEEHALLQLAEIAVKQGLLADAKSALKTVSERRAARGDRRGAAEIRVRLAAVDPTDARARLVGARASAELGETPAALEELKALADDLQDRGRPDDAIKVLAEAAEISPADQEIASALMRLHVAKGDLTEARKYAQSPDQLKQIAADLRASGQTAAAVEVLATAMALDPDDDELASEVMQLYLEAGDPVKAREYARSPEQLKQVAADLLAGGYTEEAIPLLAQVASENPDDAEVADTVIGLCLEAGDLVSARRFARTSEQIVQIVDRLQQAGQVDEAIELLGEVAASSPEDETVAARMFDLCLGAGDAGKASPYAKSAEQLKQLAAVLLEGGQTAEATEALAGAAKLAPDDADLAGAVMTLYLEAGAPESARPYARTADQLKQVAVSLQARGQADQALELLTEVAKASPADVETRIELARAYLAKGDHARVRRYLTREVAGTDPDLLWALAEMDLRAGKATEGLSIVQALLVAHPECRNQVVLLGCTIVEIDADMAYHVIDLAASASVERREWADAAAALNEFVNREPGHVPALMRLVEICVDGGLEATMFSAQGQLADAYLAAGQGAEARTIAEDLVAREPWDRANIERFRRALALLGEEDIDQVIADRLSGETPFVSTEISGTFEVAQSAPSAPPAPAKPETVGGAPKAASSKRPAPQGEEHGMFALGEEAIDIGFLSEMKEPQTPAPAADAWVNGSESSDSSEIDLSGALENLKNDSPASRSGPPAATGDGRDLEGVFKDLRDEVSRENFVNVALQHHKLAQTYLEMGMDNEALRALEVAVRAPRLRFEAASMLARIYRKRGAATEAIDWFERAAEAPAPTPDAGRELLYDLADTLEAQGETVRALAVFLELQADVGDYRDLAVRLQRLSKLQMRG